MKSKNIVPILFLFTIGLSHGQSDGEKKKELSWRMIMETETAYGFEDDDLQKSELILTPEMTLKLNDRFKIFAQGRFYYEFTDNLEPGEASTANYSSLSKLIMFNDHSQFEFREIYLDAKLGESYWRFGKQQNVWGQTEGIKVLDVINPMNWREFIMDEFDDSRIPLWSVKMDMSLGNYKVQSFWIPDLTYHQMPNQGGTFEQNVPFPELPSEIEIQVEEIDKPDNILKDSDLGIRTSTFINGWDLSLSYLYHYDDVPILVKNASFASDNSPILTISPSYQRSHLIGLTFGNTFRNFGFRGELAFMPNKIFGAHRISGMDGLYESNQITSGIGIDYFGISQTLITVQWFADAVMADDADVFLPRDHMLNYITFMISRPFSNNRIDTKIFAAYGLNNSDGLIDMKTSYLMTDNLKITLTGDVFFGEQTSIIGQFDNADRIMLGLEFGLQSRK